MSHACAAARDTVVIPNRKRDQCLGGAERRRAAYRSLTILVSTRFATPGTRRHLQGK